MKATVEKAVPVRTGAEILLTLRFCGAIPRTHTYRVSEKAYGAAGSPSVDDVLEGDVLTSLTAEEDARLAYARAVKILASGDNTRASLVRKLTERGFSRNAASAAVERLSSEGYIKENEMLLRQLAIYAKRLWGPRKFLPALLQKGFSREDIREALDEAKRSGVYDSDTIKEALLEQMPSADANARRAWLFKHGF